MWLSEKEECLLFKICSTNSLTEEELEAVKTYNGFRSIRSCESGHNGPGPGCIYPVQDILKKYGTKE